ncbi:MAG: hypothetical protein R3F21_11050 [Myxococcota bacterium]
MQLGFNTNFRYRDVIFHVQTEDSGRANPHVITHIFHGGNIIASLKSDYSALLVEADLEGAVRKLMESQHKSMLKKLSRGEFDRAIGERLGPEIFRGGAGVGAVLGESSDTGEIPASGGDTASGSAATDRTPGLSRRAPAPSGNSATIPPAASASASGSASASTSASGSASAPARGAAERTVVNPPARETTSGLARVFGDRVVSEKPLDEVVLDYLVENARKRKRQPKP